MTVLIRFIYLFIYYFILITGILCYKGNYTYLPSFLSLNLGMFLIFLLIFRKANLFLLFLLVIYGFALASELSSVFNTGKLLEVLAIANLTELSSVGNHIIYSTLWIFTAFILPIIFILKSRMVILPKNIYLLVIPLFVFCIFYCQTNPLVSFVQTFYQYTQQLFFKPQRKKMQEQMQLYGKNWVYQDINIDDMPDLREKNIVALFTEGCR